jgi:hypothetical protein
MAGYKAFQQKFMGVDLLDDAEFSDFEARKLRYAILWAMYENTAYSKMHRWSHLYKVDYGLYRWTRGIYNPCYRLGEFWKVHLLGGKLDPEAGDGKKKPSALPIHTDNENLRPAIAQLWKWSNWQIKKNVAGLWTPVLGDGVFRVVDDKEREKVYLKNVHPGTLKDVATDEFGNVKGYEIEEYVIDPRKGRGGTKVKYTEKAFRNGSNVIYQTFLNDQPYAWDENQGEEWNEPYGFVPMVVYQHNDVGLSFGFSELMPGLAQFREVDDLASKLSDQIRKVVNSKFLYIGVSKPKPDESQKTKEGDPTANNPQPGREQEGALYGPIGSDAKPLIAPLDIANSAAYIKDILANIEQDYPELSADMHNVQGDISGRALRINRAPAEDKVLERRPNYFDALKRAHQMAVAIGGENKYKGFEGFSLASYETGDLDHEIGDRPVFANDPLDDLEYDEKFWGVAQKAKTAGVPLLTFLKQKGWDEMQIAEVKNSAEYQAYMASLDAATEAAKNPPAPATKRFGTPSVR